MSEANDKPVSNLLSEEDRQAYIKNTPPKRLNLIANAFGKIALVGAAIGVVGGGARARQADDPTQPVRDAVNVSQEITDRVIPNDDKQNTAPIMPTEESSPKPQGSVGEEALSASPDLSELNKIFDTFVDDLKKIPAARMLGMQEAGVEGYKIAINEKTVKFMLKPSENDHSLDEITVEIKTDAETKNWTIIGREIEYQHKFNDPSKTEESVPPAGKSTGEILTEELNELHDKWMTQRGQNGENVTSSAQATPPENSPTAETVPSPTPEPTVIPTPNPAFNQPGPFDRENHEAIAPTSTEQPSITEETSVVAPPVQPTEIQNPQPAAADSTTPRSDL